VGKGETKFDGEFGPGIYGFFGEYRWLSNFFLTPVEFEGLLFPSVEAAYQAAKDVDVSKRQLMVGQISDDEMKEGMRARRFGKSANLRPDWESAKVDVMRQAVTSKFQLNGELVSKLLETGDLHLEETNYWGDTFWGVCKGAGRNELGKILMGVREDLRRGKTS
jgi:ribA/ribD-fused uncharacterized protein